MEESAVLLVGFKCFSNTYFHFKTKHVFRRHTTNCVGVLNAESLFFFLPPPLFLFFCLNSAAIYLECVCHIQPPVHIQASCALRQLCDYTGQAILCVCRAVDCERRGEKICSRGDLLHLSVSGFLWKLFHSLALIYVLCRSPISGFNQGPYTAKHIILYTNCHYTYSWRMQYTEDVMLFTFQETAGNMETTRLSE